MVPFCSPPAGAAAGAGAARGGPAGGGGGQGAGRNDAAAGEAGAAVERRAEPWRWARGVGRGRASLLDPHRPG